MTRVIVHGCSGFMGHVVCDLIRPMEDVEVVAGIDIVDDGSYSFPVFLSPGDCNVQADAIIDFSAAPAVNAVLDLAVRKQIPLVECTTGLSEEQISYLEECSKKVAVLRSANMSLGVNTLFRMVREAARILGDAGFDIDIVERHHRRKLDAPSGTALAFADAVNEGCDGRYSYVFDRSTRRQARPSDEIGISAVRGGTIVGDHEIIFAGTDEVIEFKHTAYSRAVFGKGAVEAAKYLAGKGPGLYNMSHVIGG